MPATRVMRTGLLELRHPDVGDRADEEGGDDDPGGPVDLTLQTPARPIATTQAVASTTDRAAQPRGLGSLHEHPGRQQHRQHPLDYEEGVLDLIHRGTPAFYRGAAGAGSVRWRCTLGPSHAASSSAEAEASGSTLTT